MTVRNTTSQSARMPMHADVPADEISQANAELGELRRIRAELNLIQARLDADVARLVSGAQAEVQQVINRVPHLESSLTEFANKYRGKLGKGRGKTDTITLPNGKLIWKFTTLALDIDDETAALEYLRENGLMRRFTRVKRVILKEKLKADPVADSVPGITVHFPEETFQIIPDGVKLNTDTKLQTSNSDQVIDETEPKEDTGS